MKRRRLARRYGEALGELAREHNLLDQIEEELALVRETLTSEPRLLRVLEDQNVTAEAKDQLIQSLFGKRLSRYALNFLRLVVKKQREAYLLDMIDAYVAYANEKRGIVEVEITAAAPLTDEQAKLLTEKLSRVTGQKVRLMTQIDEAILGGVIARIGDLVMDGSVRTRLELLGESLRRAQLN
ncbi:MAG: ATP synthase F1 subunit delta [Clostridia bacterium]|nr:F0F1 ATP synthase subunit delta [Bacillota bacterium]MBO2521886.1 F0F1 ATP synthase subunit delta [Bacillota bacterium]